MTVMDVEPSIPGYASHPVARLTALRHAFISPDKGQNIDGDDPHILQRRMGDVPATVNAQELYERFSQEARADNNSSASGEEKVTPFPLDIDGIHARMQRRLVAGENPDRAHFEAVLDLVEAVWGARDTRSEHTATQRREHEKWMAKAASAEAEHAQELDLDRPRNFDGSFKENAPRVVYEAYKHI